MKLEEWQKSEKFIPLTYLEILRDKPLLIKLDKKWRFVTNLQHATNFAIFIDRKDFILAQMEAWFKFEPKTDDERIQKNIGIVNTIKMLIQMLFDISCGEYNGRKRAKYRNFLFDFLTENTEILYDIWARVLEYNTRLKKKLEYLKNFKVVQDPGPWTSGEDFLSAEELCKPRFYN